MFATTFPEAELDEEILDAAARMGDLRVTPDDMERERPRVLEELGNMFANFPPWPRRTMPGSWSARLRAAADTAARPSPSGPCRTLDVQEHLGRFYRPRNAIVSVSGAFDPAKARQAIQTHFAKLAPGEKARPARSPGPPNFGAVKEINARSPDPDARPMACLAYLAPSPESELYAPFLVLISRLWAGAEKLGGDGMGFPVYFTPIDDGAVVAVSTPARPGESAKQAFARLEAFVAETVGPKLRADEAAATLQ